MYVGIGVADSFSFVSSLQVVLATEKATKKQYASMCDIHVHVSVFVGVPFHVHVVIQ